jgi:hypothetical protein
VEDEEGIKVTNAQHQWDWIFVHDLPQEQCDRCGLIRGFGGSKNGFVYWVDSVMHLYLDVEPGCDEVLMRKALR